jgi:hypothetical protein
MRLPSTTVASSTQSTPALTMSSRMAAILVARRPLRMPAEMGTQPAWQMKAMGLASRSKVRIRSRMWSWRRSLSGAYPPGITRTSKPAALTAAVAASGSTGPWPFLPDWLSVEAGEGDLDLLLTRTVERVEQLHVLEVVGGQMRTRVLAGPVALMSTAVPTGRPVDARSFDRGRC